MTDLSTRDADRCEYGLERGAYYYSFQPTGDGAIDLILGAISIAGKQFHNTEDWATPLGVLADANTVIDLIQQAANDAARERKDSTTALGEEEPTYCTCSSVDEEGNERCTGQCPYYLSLPPWKPRGERKDPVPVVESPATED